MSEECLPIRSAEQAHRLEQQQQKVYRIFADALNWRDDFPPDYPDDDTYNLLIKTAFELDRTIQHLKISNKALRDAQQIAGVPVLCGTLKEVLSNEEIPAAIHAFLTEFVEAVEYFLELTGSTGESKTSEGKAPIVESKAVRPMTDSQKRLWDALKGRAMAGKELVAELGLSQA